MEKTWTSAQSAAIQTHDKTLLVSAAAGSGKTATLTERILRSLINDEADIEKMLIVTFTRASAAELRTRISSALSEALANDPTNAHLNAQLLKLDRARICTIDSFYLDLIRDNFSSLALSHNFRIADTAEMDVLSVSVMNKVIDRFYEIDPDFSLLTECFSGIRGQDALVDVFLSVASRCESLPEGISFLHTVAERTHIEAELDFFDTSFGLLLCHNLLAFAEHLYELFLNASSYVAENPDYVKPYAESFAYLTEFAERILSTVNQPHAYAELSKLFADYSLPRIGRLPKGAEPSDTLLFYKELRKTMNEKIKKLAQKSFSQPQESITHSMLQTAYLLQKLFLVLSEFEAYMNEEKQLRNILTFSDIRRYAMRLLVDENGSPTEIAKSYAQEFSEIYIDEYQDVDRVQDEIFRAISRADNRFMVGDIKQSIYGFRGAEPQVFADYRAAFPLHDPEAPHEGSAESIFMSNNFRCDRTVIDFTNSVCSFLFSCCAESLDYRPEDDLVFSKPRELTTESPVPVTVAVITSPTTTPTDEDFEDEENDTEDYDKNTAEAQYVANEIRRLLREETLNNGKRIRPGDIAVLSRNRAMLSYIEQALRDIGIATTDSGMKCYFENPDVLMVLCLLNTIDNPHRDVYLAGTLRSPIFSFTMEDLVRIRKASSAAHSLYDALIEICDEPSELGKRAALFCEQLHAWREAAASLPVERLLRVLFDSDPFVASGLVNTKVGSSDGGNLLLLYEYARHFEASSFKGLYGFIEFLNTMIEQGRDIETPTPEPSADRVSLMTIHQSKGLEFPVCFICGASKKFNRSDTLDSLLLAYPHGVAMKLADESGLARVNTPLREALHTTITERATEEEMRVLYVALTRARERLYVTGSTAKEEALKKKALLVGAFPSRHTILSCSSFLEWILSATVADSSMQDSSCRVIYVAGESVFNDDTPTVEWDAPLATETVDTALLEQLQKDFAFSYPYAALAKIPAKISVSRLSPELLDADDPSVDLIPARSAEIPDFFRADGKHRYTAAERGTGTHLFLQFCDFEALKKGGVREEFSRLSSLGFLPPQAEEQIYFEDLERFVKSRLFSEISTAKQIIREQRFNILLPPDGFTKNPLLLEQIRGESLAVQGVIDLIVITEDDRLCLYDYKTDRLSSEELSSSDLASAKMNALHGLQLSYYAKAAEALFGRPCDVLGVYSTHAARLFPIALQDLSIPTIS